MYPPTDPERPRPSDPEPLSVAPDRTVRLNRLRHLLETCLDLLDDLDHEPPTLFDWTVLAEIHHLPRTGPDDIGVIVQIIERALRG